MLVFVDKSILLVCHNHFGYYTVNTQIRVPPSSIIVVTFPITTTLPPIGVFIKELWSVIILINCEHKKVGEGGEKAIVETRCGHIRYRDRARLAFQHSP